MFRSALRILPITILLSSACTTDAPTAADANGLSPRFESGSGSGGGGSEATPVSFTITPDQFVGGGPGTPTGKVTVSNTASFDRLLSITTNNSQVLPFLSKAATVASGTNFAVVQIIPSAVSTPTTVTIFATGNGVTVSADLLVTPEGTPPPPPTLSSYSVSPSTVSAGTTATGTITLPSPAGSNGVVVSLFSRIPGSASVPSSVTVPAGETSAQFPVSTFVGFPNSTTSVLLSAVQGNTTVFSSINVVTGGSTSTSLTAPSLLKPSSDARLTRGSTVAFDWNDVANAVSYTIQVGSRDNFPSPLIADQTVSTSQTSIAGLPTRTMWWRVRANSSNGTSGPWSSVRRFELK